MGKHLSIKEKLNAENELIQNRNEVLELRKELKIITDTERRKELIARWQDLKKRNKKLNTHITYSKKSVHKGQYGINGICYNMFGKKTCELNKEERKQYNKVMKAKQRERTGNIYDREYGKIYDLTHKEEKRERKRLWAIKNKDKIKQNYLKRKLEKQKQRGYGPYEGSWTFKTFGKRYKDMTEEEKRQRQIVYKKMKAKEMKSE